MNVKVHKIGICMSKLAIYAMIACQSLIMAMASELDAQRKRLVEIPIHIEATAEVRALSEVLSEIESKGEFTFAYSKRDLRGKVIELAQQQWTMESLLREISVQGRFSIRRVNEMITLNPVKEQELPDVNEKVTIQTRITGNITDENGEPLPGATILEKGTTNGTTTDIEGNFQISVPEDAVLSISFVGFKTKEVAIGGQSVINVSLDLNSESLDEVVVIGFGERSKKDLTGSISSVGSEEIDKMDFAAPEFALQGNTTGVRVINTSGDPNAPPQIYVRGIGSWQGNAQPLYVIDGQVITPPTDANLDLIGTGDRGLPNLWTMINPDDIESITVLKDASSAAIYGSRGANGVILITTKNGKTGKPKVEFDYQTSWQNIKTYDMLNTAQYRDIVNEMYANNLNPNITMEDHLYGWSAADDTVRRINFSPQFDPSSPFYISSNETYDWQEELVRQNAKTETYDVRISGGNETGSYYVGVGYDNREGMMYGNDLETYRASVNVSSDISKYLEVGINYKFALQEVGMNDYSTMDEFSRVAPWQPLYDESNEFGFAEVMDPPVGDWRQVKRYGQGSQTNYLAYSDLNRREFNNQRHIGQGYVTIKPLEGLSFRASINLDYTDQTRVNLRTYRTNIFTPNGEDPTTDSPDAPSSLGQYGTRENRFFNYQFDFMGTYARSFGDHDITLTGAVQDIYNTRYNQDLSTYDIRSLDNIDRISIRNDLMNTGGFSGWQQRFWYGYVGRVNYSYDKRYYLDVSVRRDASVGMSEENRWGTFWSVSGAWRISSEPFMQGLTFIDDLKLRGGYGEAGNDETAVGRYAYLSGVGAAGSIRFGSGNGDPIGNTYYIGSHLNAFPNTELVWEVSKTSYFGFDALLLNNKMNVTAEFYIRRQDGIQQTVELPLSVGVGNPIFNIGELENKGIDLNLGYNDRIGEFTYSASTNISLLKNEVINLYNDQPLTVTNQFGVTYRVEEGRSLGHIWGYKTGGIFQSQQEIDEFYASTPDQTVTDRNFIAPGDMYFLDVHGDPTEEEPFYSTTPDGQVNVFDQTEIGNTIPAMTYGINLSGGYKGITLSMSFYGEAFVDKYNSVRAAHESMNSANSNYRLTVLDRWTEANTGADMPRAVVGDPARNNRYSDRFVESAAFFRLNTWRLSYDIPDFLLSKIDHAISSLQIFVGGQNNIYLHSWNGLDPVNDAYPLPKSFTLGVKSRF